MGRELAVHVRAHADRDRPGRRQQRRRRTPAGARGPSHSVNSSSNWSTTTSWSGRRWRSRCGSLPGVSTRASWMPGSSPARAAADHPGAQHRGLAAARGADDRQQPAGRQPRDQLGDDLFAAEEVVAVLGLERQQAAVRALGRRQPGLRCPGPLSAWIRSGAARPSRRCGPRSTSSYPSGRCRRTSSAVTAERKICPPSAWPRSRAARLIDEPEVVGAAPLGLAGVQREPDGDAQIARATARPASARVAASAASTRARRGVEHRHGRVALARRLHQPPAVRRHAVGDHLVVADERLGHRRRLGLPHRARPLDVRHAERDHAGRQRRGPARPQPLDQLPGRRRPARRDRSPVPVESRPRAARPARVDPLPGRQHAGRRRTRSAARTRSPPARTRRWPATERRRPPAPAPGSPASRAAAQRARRRGQAEVDELDPAARGQDQVRRA